MLKGIDINQRIEFTLSEDTSEPKTVFVFKPITGSDMLKLSEGMEGGQLKLSGEKLFDLLEMTIVEVKNFEPTGAVRDIIKSLPPMVFTKVVSEAIAINRLTEQDSKN
jgi:hypothetical protein